MTSAFGLLCGRLIFGISFAGVDMLFAIVDGMHLLSLPARELGIGAIYELLGCATLKICERTAIKRGTLEMF